MESQDGINTCTYDEESKEIVGPSALAKAGNHTSAITDDYGLRTAADEKTLNQSGIYNNSNMIDFRQNLNASD